LLLSNPDNFTVSERAGLTNDQLVLARFGYQKTSSALAFIGFLAHERDYTVWNSALGELGYMDSLMVDMDCYASFRVCVVVV
jgi:ERAP1-like C-terminal domain